MSLPVPLLSVRDLSVHYPLKRSSAWPWARAPVLKAVDGVSFDVFPGEILGVVGESGCGKSTLARALLNMAPATAGSLSWRGQSLLGARKRAWLAMRREVQMVFQDPLASLDPRMTVGEIIAEPLRTHCPKLSRADAMQKVRAMMARVGLSDQQLNRYPHEFSGGQCQRIGIARALVLQPRLVICDEPVSALDVSIQAQIINLLKELQAEMGLSLLFIAHDLAVVKHLSQRVMVMYLGRAVEIASKPALYASPGHPYTRALLSAVALPDPRRERGKRLKLLPGDLPSPVDPPSGCSFRTRCPQATPACAADRPVLRALSEATQVACGLA